MSSRIQDLAAIFAAKGTADGAVAWAALSSKDKKAASKAHYDLVVLPARDAEAQAAGYASDFARSLVREAAADAAARDARLAAYDAAELRNAQLVAAMDELAQMSRSEIAAAVGALVGAPVAKAKLNVASAYYLVGGIDLRVSDHGQVEGGGLDLTTGYRNGEATASIDPVTVADAGSLKAAIERAAELIKAAIAEMAGETS